MRAALSVGRRGATAVEFALICMPAVIFLFGVFYIGLHFYSQQSLDYAVQEAARQVEIGAIGAKYSQTDFVNEVICPNFGPNCAGLYVDLHPVSDYTPLASSTVDAPDSGSTTGFQFCTGGPGQMMYAHVVYVAPSPFAAILGLPSNDLIVSNAAFINENPTGITVTQADGC